MMIEFLNSYDWKEVFAFAGEGELIEDEWGYSNHGLPQRASLMPRDPVSLRAFGREDVKSIEGIAYGDNDGPSWIIYGELKDGRWFSIIAACDYTGWDCQAGGRSFVGSSLREIEAFGLGDEERERLEVVLDPEPDERLIRSDCWK